MDEILAMLLQKIKQLIERNKNNSHKITVNEKSHFSVLFSLLGDGTTFKPMIICKRKTMSQCNFPIFHSYSRERIDKRK